MKTFIIHYFSGTGNTAHAVKMVTDRLREQDFEVKLIPINKNVKPPETTPDFHLIAFPVLSWAAPVLVKKYLSEMKTKAKTPVAILAINGAIISGGKMEKGYTGQALEEVETMLKRRGFDVFLTGNASFPDNWTQFTNPCAPDAIRAIFQEGELEVRSFTEKFLSGEKELYRCGLRNIIWSGIIAYLFDYVGRRVLGKFYIADQNCTGCGICVKSCPVGAIKMGKWKPWWRTTCEDCNRCINICPEKAIQVSLPLFIFQIAINLGLTIGAITAILDFFPRMIGDKMALISLEVLAITVAVISLIWVTLVPLDAFFRLLMKLPGVRRFMCRSFTSGFRRYTAPGFNPLVHQTAESNK
ncbi:MAG TPA: EFR1 family ferrodoxin [Prolixibacteraceae bacterium]|nr:EFR1 family ferrodoxin [Prolixibacteraceae bacterium]